MIVKSLRVRNFRCLLDTTLPCESLTALVGANGCGKSSLLQAFVLFYDPSPVFDLEDFYNRDSSNDIEISVTFSDLEDEARERFAPYLDGEYLTVTRVLSWQQGRRVTKLHGSRRQHAAFVPIRTASGANPARQLYNELRQHDAYADLPAVTSRDAALSALKAWETAHPDRCELLRDDGQFFGFNEVGDGYLGRFTCQVYIPAVRDAGGDAAEGRGSPITTIMDLVIRRVLGNRPEIQALREKTQRQYDTVMDPANLSELGALADQLTNTVATYVPGAQIDLRWRAGKPIDIPLPQADVGVIEDGYRANVGKTGHGLQRAFILSLLQHLAVAQITSRSMPPADLSADATDEERALLRTTATMPALLLLIEEPELYQHPGRQRHLASVLLKLTNGVIPGVSGRTQVIYGTHSPLFVGLDRFDQIRVLRKLPSEGGPSTTRVTHVVGDHIAEELSDAGERPHGTYTWATLRPRLHAVMTPWMAEGFFAEVAVLVEGEEDRASLIGVARAMGYDLEASGCCIIPCRGKANIDRPTAIFRKFGIPTYAIWDGDRDGPEREVKGNRLLLRLHGQEAEDWPDTRVEATFACFEKTLHATLKAEIGDASYETIFTACCTEMDLRKQDAAKNPVLIEQVLHIAHSRSLCSPTLCAIVERILALAPGSVHLDQPSAAILLAPTVEV